MLAGLARFLPPWVLTFLCPLLDAFLVTGHWRRTDEILWENLDSLSLFVAIRSFKEAGAYSHGVAGNQLSFSQILRTQPHSWVAFMETYQINGSRETTGRSEGNVYILFYDFPAICTHWRSIKLDFVPYCISIKSYWTHDPHMIPPFWNPLS